MIQENLSRGWRKFQQACWRPICGTWIMAHQFGLPIAPFIFECERCGTRELHVFLF